MFSQERQTLQSSQTSLIIKIDKNYSFKSSTHNQMILVVLKSCAKAPLTHFTAFLSFMFRYGCHSTRSKYKVLVKFYLWVQRTLLEPTTTFS